MERKFFIGIVVLIFALGTTVAAIPPAKAQESPITIRVRDYISGDMDNIYPEKTRTFLPWNIRVYVVSPIAWAGTSDGIVSWTLSVRFDPRAIEVYGASQVGDIDADGYPEGFLQLYALASSLSTVFASPPVIDKTTGSLFGTSESLYDPAIGGKPTHGAGGDLEEGDNEMPLVHLSVNTRAAPGYTINSPIDLIETGMYLGAIDIGAKFVNARGETIIPNVEDGYYRGTTPDITFQDLLASASVIGSTWHELYPTYSQEYRIDSHIDTDGDGALDASEQIDMTNLQTLAKYSYHVDWVNPTPTPDDGMTDLIVTKIAPAPEFPLGLAPIMMLAPLIAIVYLWRTRKKVMKQ